VIFNLKPVTGQGDSSNRREVSDTRNQSYYSVDRYYRLSGFKNFVYKIWKLVLNTFIYFKFKPLE